MITIAIILALLVVLVVASLYVVNQKTAAVIERFGRFNRVGMPGLNIRIPFVDRIVQRVDLRVQQIDMDIETKTEDNVTVLVRCSVQFEVAAMDPNLPGGINSEGVKAAVYSLSNPGAQIRTYVADAVRGKVPNMSLDETFSDKAAIADHVSDVLQSRMSGYGFHILNTLVPDVAPTDARVLSSMNNVMASLREKEARVNEAEGERAAIVIKAEAEKSATVIQAEADKAAAVILAEGEKERYRLEGEGMALQRKAVAEGLAVATQELGATTGGAAEETLRALIMAQQIESQTSFARADGTSTVLLPPAADNFNQNFSSVHSALRAAQGESPNSEN